MRVRRVGSISCGLILIVFGIAFLLHMIFPVITFAVIFKFWPLILIVLGAEILLSNIKPTEKVLKYDAGAIVLVIVLTLFSMGMGFAEYCMRYFPEYF